MLEPNPPHNPPSILIVDDAPANLELLTGTLRERGYEPRPIPSGKLALAAARADPPDLILLDIRMPEMDGFEVCKRLKADPVLKEIPVIFITALTDTEEKVRAFSLGAADYVTKPFQVEEIEARLQAHLRIRTLQRQLTAQNQDLERLVAERTRKLALTLNRLLELSRLKDDFLGMISHELRTPANGVLGIGQLILELCPVSENSARLGQLYRESSTRLRNLIEDSAMIADIERAVPKSEEATAFLELLSSVQETLPAVHIDLSSPLDLTAVLLQGNARLLKKTLLTLCLLAAAFSKNKHTLPLRAGIDQGGALRLHFDLDDLILSDEEVSEFFAIASSVRSSSAAESLGLAPVVAHKIITAFNGELKLVKKDFHTGYLEAIFPGRAEQL